MAQELAAVLVTAIEGAVAAAVYAALVYARNRKSGEDFKPFKFFSVVIVGAVVGASLALSGNAVTSGSFEARWAAYAGMTVVVEGLLKAAWRYLGLPAPGS